MADNPELLFFDTFSHGSTQVSSPELNLDLVQFTNSVYVNEIRVIPLGARVQADFPGGVRLGATNPSEFSVEFFVNDLSTPGASTFQNIGVLEYNQNGPIHLVCENKQLPTDGLILRGWYTTVTLAVYGFITKTRPPPSNLVAQNPPPASETPPPRVISEHKTAEWVHLHAQVYHKEAIPYDVKDLPYEEENLEWPSEKVDDTQWEKNEQNSEIVPSKEDKKNQHKIKKIEEEVSKSPRQHSSVEDEFSDREEDYREIKKRDDKKPKTERCHHSPSKSKHKVKNELKKKSSKHEPDEIKLEPVVIPCEKREKTPEVNESLPSPKIKEAIGSVSAPVDPGSLAPEDVESISEEEISETEDVPSPDMSSMLVTDEVTEVPIETRTPSAHEDSLDMDQFEPILSGSSDIESEEDIDFQDIELDSNDLMEETNKIFNPYLFEVQPLTSLKSPYITEYEWALLQPKVLEQSVIIEDKSEKLRTSLSNLELKSFEDSPDDWVTTVENMIPGLESGLIGTEDRSDLIRRLIDLVNIGLDFEKAYYQPKAVFKVRHLKAGVILVERLCHLGEEVNTELVKCTDVQHKLLNLYEKEYLALSIKLAILRALDASLNYGYGVKSFVNFESEENGYRRLVRIFCTSRTARIRYSLANLLRKIHLFEVLENLYSLTISIPNNVLGLDIDHVTMCLEDTIRYIREAPLLIGQPIRFLPFSSRFEFPCNSVDGQMVIFSYFRHFHFLDLLLAVLTSPHYSSNSNILSCALEIIAELLDTENGLIYLATEVNTTNRILKLLSNSDDQYSLSPHLGLHMAHRIYVLNLVDGFQYKWQIEQNTDIDNTQLLEITSSLFCLTFTVLGRQAATHVLSRGDLIKPFLKALQYSHNTGRERRKSPGKAYITDLMWMVIRCSDHVPFLQRHRTDLIDIASWQSDPTYSSWLNPVRTECFLSYNDVTDLCDYLKKHTEKVITYPGELITALRILRYLSIPAAGRKSVSHGADENDDESIELRYKYVLIQLFSQEGLTFMTSMLHKICNHYERSHLHACTLAGKEGVAMMSVLLPTLQLVRALIDYVVRCRDVDFKDLTAVPALLKTYCLLYSVPPTSSIQADTIDAGKEIIETLLAYTQTVAIEPLSDSRTLDKSLWTSMMAEVLRFSISGPEMFVPCLSLLSELLPLPLPIQTRHPLSEVEISLVTNSRKLWSAHMLPLDDALFEMIGTLCWSSYPTLLQLLKRVCVQFADLGPPTALVVARAILDNLWSELQSGERNLTSRCSHLLNVLACLLTHPPMKMTMIQITSASAKSDETFSEFWPTLLKYLLHPLSDCNTNNFQAHEYILSSIQCLCDIGISLCLPPGPHVSLETYLSNSLPPKHLFRPMCDALVKYVECAENSFPTLSSAIRACVTLTEYDYGIYRLKNCLSEHSNALYNVLNKLATEWSKENADCINCLSSLLEFLKECLPREVIADSEVNLRTLSVSSTELAGWLKWTGEREDNQKHPLEQIDTFLSECSSDEELYQSLRSNVNALVDTLNAVHSVESEADPTIEMIVNPPELLLTQFQARPVFVVGDVEDERLSSAYWLSVTAMDDMEPDVEQVVCNLEEIVNMHISNLQLETELEKLGHREVSRKEQMSKKVELNEPTEEFESKPIPTVLAVKPVKPRTFIRPISGPHRNDAFRSRIPNSSRAPSLHVDDFIALEKHNQQQAATSAYNRVGGKHQVQDAAVVRNRNHTFLQERGSHFHSPFRPARGVLSTWHPLIATEPAGRPIVKTQPSVIRHPGAAPLMIRGADLMRFSLSLRWPTPPLRPPPPPQMRHHPPPHASMHRHLRPPPPSFSPL